MAEKLLSEYTGPISVEQNTVAINGRPFPSVIGIIGGGTLLESLIIARQNPDSAIIVVDSLAGFGQNLLDQLIEINGGERKKLDWGFFEEDTRLQYYYEAIWQSHQRNDDTWNKMNKALIKSSATAARAANRLFLVPKETGEFNPDKRIFDEIKLTYPGRTHHLDRSIDQFIAEGLKPHGKVKIISDHLIGYLFYFAYGGRFLTEHGRVKRPNGIKHPLSLYDFVVGSSGYFFVDIQSGDNPLPIRGDLSLSLRNTAYGIAFTNLLEYFSSKKKTYSEK